jgi:hypothetical protein
VTPSDALQRKLWTLEGLARNIGRVLRGEVSLPSEVRAMGQCELEMLTGSDTFTWRDDLLRAALSAAETLPAPVTFTADLAPSPSGFYMFERPVVLDGVKWPICAVAWHPLSGPDYTVLTLYMNDRKHPGELIACSTSIMAWGADLDWGEVVKADNLDDPRAYGAMHGKALDLRKMTTDDEIDMPRMASSMVRFLCATWIWLKQRVLVPERAPTGGKSVAQAERHGMNTTVRVVTLRRSESAGHGDSANKEWACKWIVRGHWRQQYYPSTSEHRPKWIDPYVKGPDDKPLKAPTQTVYVVNR